jgi:hypothetical protein
MQINGRNDDMAWVMLRMFSCEQNRNEVIEDQVVRVGF